MLAAVIAAFQALPEAGRFAVILFIIACHLRKNAKVKA
jgi:hypothetical protein